VVIYRTLTENTTQVVAVAHTSRRPGYWKQRLWAGASHERSDGTSL